MGRLATVGRRDVEVMAMMRMRIWAMWMMGLLTVAVALVLMGVFHVGIASAAANDSRIGVAASDAGSGANSASAFTPIVAEDEGDLWTVWSAALTAGESEVEAHR